MSAIYALLLLALVSAHASAENWPSFRGPSRQGASTERELPVEWSADKTVKWKTAIPGEGWSSPILWQDRIFLTSAREAGTKCHVIALDRKTGAVLWDKAVIEQTPLRKEGKNSYATPTPATDGETVFAVFGDGSIVALDF